METKIEDIEKELEISSKRYRLLFNEVPVTIYEGNENWETVRVNPQVYVLTGYKPEELLHKKVVWGDIIHAEDKKRIFEEGQKMFEEECVLVQIYRIVRKDGGICWVEDTKSSKFENGRLSSIQGIVKDISDRKKREKLEEERMNLQKIESLGLLAGGIAHDYNNVLVSIIGSIELLKLDPTLNEDQKELLGELKYATGKAKKLTNQLLTFAKGGKPITKLQDVSQIVETSIKNTLINTNCDHSIEIVERLPQVEVDENQFELAVNNILINAVQSMPKGGRIDIKIDTKDIIDLFPLTDGSYLEISIKDQGIGIPKSNAERIFVPYFTTKKNRNGLGLATSRSIIKNHNGCITYKSEEGMGTIFYIYLPVGNEGFKSAAVTSKDQKIGKVRNVLVLDDSSDVHRTLNRLLKELEIKMVSTYNSKETIEKYQAVYETENKFDLVILDLNLPNEAGGKETIKQLRELDSDIVAVVSSGYSDDPIMAEHRLHGFNAALPKPYSIDQLRKLIDNLFK